LDIAMTSRSSFLALLSGAFVALSALPGTAQAQRCAVTEVEVPALQIRVGTREQLLVIFRDRTGIPCDTDPAFTATSSNAAVARIDRTGGVWTVVGVAPGAAAITVRTGTGRTARSGIGTVVVQAQDLDTGQSLRPQPTPIVEPPQPVNRDPIVATPGGATLRYQVRTSSTPAIGIIATPERLQLLPGEARVLSYRTADVTGAQAEALPLQFQVEPSAALRFVQVDSIGIVSTTDTGSATIRITAIGRTSVRPALVPVEVRADSVRFVRNVVSMAPNTVDTLRLRVVDQNREIAVGQVYQFSSSDTTVARVHLFQSVVEARSPGTAIITATNIRLQPVQATVRVFRPITAIQLADSQITIAIRQQRRVTMRPVADTTYIREAPAVTTGLDTTFVTAVYDSAAGAWSFTGKASGTTSVTMRVQNGRDSTTAVQRTLTIRVVAGGLQLSRTRVGLGPGERTPVGVTLLDDRRQPIAGVTPEVTWISSDSNVARFENGQVVARAVGRATLQGRTPWDSVATIEAHVVPDMLVIKQRTGAWNIYGRTAAGTWTPVTSDSLVESFPTWSRDLTRIAWAVRPAGRPRGGDLYVANPDGSEPRRVFGLDSGVVMRPQFVGPAGDRLVFELSFPSDGRSEIWTANLDGTNARRLPLGGAGVTFAGFPSVSPDGQRLLYVSLRPGPGLYDVYVSNIDGSGEQRVTTYVRADEAPVWAPDGNSFFFLRDEGEVSRRPSKRVYRFTIGGDSAVAISPPGNYVAAFGVSGDGATIALSILDGASAMTRYGTISVAAGPTGTITPITLDTGELAAPASPIALRPVTPQPAAGAAPPPRP
jgi:uncharacterized protein YjdB